MPILHRFINELNDLEDNQQFCGRNIVGENNLLIIGTFNPDDNSCVKENDATWFYGRQKNLFWQYLPLCLTGNSLHISLGFTVKDWKTYCFENRIVIVDLLKKIDHNKQLEDFKDKRLDERINNQMTNMTIFDFNKAFQNVTFKKVIYSRKGWDSAKDVEIVKLIQIKCAVNNILIQDRIINSLNQIKYCPAPWQQRPMTQPQWCNAIKS